MVARKRAIIIASATIFFTCFLFLTLNRKESSQVNEQETIFEGLPQPTQSNAHPVPQEQEQNQPTQQSHPDRNQNTNQENHQNAGAPKPHSNILDRLPNIAPTEDIILENNMWIPAGWSGLPLSFDNPLYFDPNVPEIVQHRNELVNALKQIDDWKENDEIWNQLLSEYENLIGWNGIFDAVDQAQKELGIDVAVRLHALGEALARSKLVTNNRYIVEITSRDILHKAPMHGGVWSIVKGLLDQYAVFQDISVLFKTIDEELCFFKNEENMGNIWISCVHGVGHGFANYYGVEGIPVALDICAQHSDEQYRYACATGIFMDLEENFPGNTFAPCDTNRFAPACYRFKTRLFNQLFVDVEDPCSTQPSAYHKRACIWGRAYVAPARPADAYTFCEPYRPANVSEQPAANDYATCFDGFLGSHEVANIPPKQRSKFCDALLPYEKAYSVCSYYLDIHTLRRFTFSSGEEEEDDVNFYNYELLEELYDPYSLGNSADWLPEWDHIIPQQQNKVNPPKPATKPHNGH